MKSYGDEYFDNPNQRIIDDSVYMFIETLNSVEGNDIYIDDIPCKAYITNTISPNSETKEERTISVLVEQPIKTGDYIEGYDDGIYLVTTDIDNHISHKEAKIRKCNHLLKWMYKGNLYSMQSITINQTKYTLGISTIVAGITEGDSRYVITLPYNPKTNNIKVGQRFIFNANAWKVTQTDFVSEVGLLSILLGQDSINTEIDDVDNEIANRWQIKHNYNTTCESSLSITKGSNYNLIYNFTDNNQAIDNNLITVENSSNLISVIKSNDGKITISGVDIGTGSFKVKLNLTDEVREFIVNFEVVSNVVADKIDYKITTSNGYVYRVKEGSTLVAIRYINGNIDNSLVIDYQLDLVGQDLLNKQNISIIKKSDSSFIIRNVNINALKTFKLTIIDKTTGDKILDNQIITLKGM